MTAPIIDVHTHLAPDLAGTAEFDGVDLGEGGRLVIDGHRVAAPGLYDADRLSRSLTSHGIDAAWVSTPPPTYRQGLDPDETRAWAHTLDAGMRKRLAPYPTLGLLSYLPFDQPKAALDVARELATVDSVGWTASAGGSSAPLDHPDLEPVWHLLEETGRPLLLHPGESPDKRLAPFYLSNLLGNPVETGVAAAQLLLGGVLTRHPGLKILLVHCGGVVPALVGRWARGVVTERPGISASTVDPTHGVRSLWADTLAHSPQVVDLALQVFGADRLVLGSDYPFPMGVDDPLESIAHLDAGLRDRIARNAANLIPRSRN